MLHKTVDLESTGRARGTAICSSLLPLHPPPPQASWRAPNPRCALRLSHTIRQHSLDAPAAGHGADGGPVLTVRRPANRETGALKRGVSGAAGNPEESVANPLWRKRGGLS